MTKRTFGSILLASLLSTAAVGTAQAFTTGNGTYYAPPSWDLTLPAATRFIVLSNFNSDAVLDRETGLVWQRTPSTVVSTFAGAQQLCSITGVGSRLGWRVPSVDELASLFDRTVGAPPYLPIGHPFNVPPNGATFWTSTANGLESEGRSFIVGYGIKFLGQPPQFILELAPTNTQRLFLCVRGPR